MRGQRFLLGAMVSPAGSAQVLPPGERPVIDPRIYRPRRGESNPKSPGSRAKRRWKKRRRA